MENIMKCIGVLSLIIGMIVAWNLRAIQNAVHGDEISMGRRVLFLVGLPVAMLALYFTNQFAGWINEKWHDEGKWYIRIVMGYGEMLLMGMWILPFYANGYINGWPAKVLFVVLVVMPVLVETIRLIRNPKIRA